MMNICKENIKRSFAKSCGSYDDNALVQKQIVRRVKELLDIYLPAKELKALEVGCGTGLMTKELKTIPQTGELFINDLVEEMCMRSAAANELSLQSVISGDIEQIEIPYGLDLIVSTSTFQWLATPEHTFIKLASHLLPEGLLVFSTFGKENLKEITALTGNGLNYMDREELEQLLSPHFDVLYSEEEQHTLAFEDPLDILRHLKNTGVNGLKNKQHLTPGVLSNFIRNYSENFKYEGNYSLTYHPLYFVCRLKNGS